jgi:hypothetical protein
MSYLQPLSHKIKDSLNLFYKRVETIIDISDPHYNKLSKVHFGHKCQLFRDIDDLRFVTEVFVPTLKTSADAKINKYVQIMRSKKTNRKEEGQKESFNLNQKLVLKSSIAEFLEPPAFETDADMKKINFSDFQSEISSYDDKDSTSQKSLKKDNKNDPFNYYLNLMKKLKCKFKEKKKPIKRQFFKVDTSDNLFEIEQRRNFIGKRDEMKVSRRINITKV